jgi:hypothetical protein
VGKRIMLGDKCLDHGLVYQPTSNPPTNLTVAAIFTTCRGTEGSGWQRWKVTSKLKIKNLSTGLCLGVSGSLLRPTSCESNTATQTFAWHPQP